MVLAALQYELEESRPPDLVADARASYGARRLPESILHAAWRRAGRSGLVLKSGEGRSYRVIYPGRPAGGQGPDFVDAIIETAEGARICGDIEIHVRSADWRAHGHSGDARYNGVLFHVALADSGADTVTRSGRSIPLLVMGQSAVKGDAAGQDDSSSPRASLPVPILDMGAAGDERFANRSDGYAHEIQVLGADQAIYEGLMDCMGFPRNRAGFRRLARRLPWNELVSSTTGQDGPPIFEECLLWAAGLGARPGHVPSLTGRSPDWVRQPGRPDNRPERRIRGIAGLLGRMLEVGGPAAYCVAAVSGHETRDLRSMFVAHEEHGRAFIGPSRASEIVVDAVLPFVHALGTLRRDAPLAERAFLHYRNHPPLSPNSLLREASLVLSSMIETPAKLGAREQQGLIHVYRMMTSKIVRPRQLPLV